MLFNASRNTPRWQGAPQRRLNKRMQAGLFAILVIGIWILTVSPWRLLDLPRASDIALSTTAVSNLSPYAYVTFLAPSPIFDDDSSIPDFDDEYFIATRILAYQLLHQPSTKTNTSIPFVVICTEDVRPSKIERLRADGATVIIVEKLLQEWTEPGIDGSNDILSKLRMLELTQYEKILYMDSDTLIIKRMDTIFDDPTTMPQSLNSSLTLEDEGPLPKEYIFSAQTLVDRQDHTYPEALGDYFSGGFFLLRPSISMFNYYMKIASVPEHFDIENMEQGVLNHAHRKDGPIPWQEIDYRYTTSWPTMNEVRAGAHSLHEEFWNYEIELDEELRNMWTTAKGEMLAFYGREEVKTSAT